MAPCALCRRIFEERRLHLDFVPTLSTIGDFTRLLCDGCYLGVQNGRLAREGSRVRLEASDQARD